MISSKGAGKTPLLAALGLYCLLADGESGAHVISMASSFEQANLTFDCAKKYVAGSDELSSLRGLDPQQHQIRAPKNSKWTTISGKPIGRSGTRPSALIADELHEWQPPTVAAFDLLTANLFKRRQPLLLMATNAGPDRDCFAHQVHQRAVRCIETNGQSDPRLLPVIFEADKSLDWKSEEAAKAANPSLGEIVSFDRVREEQAKGENRYRRLYLSQWVTGSEKWLDMSHWRACEQDLPPIAKLRTLPMIAHLDLSESDDLTALAQVWDDREADAFYARVRHFIPAARARQYIEKDLIPYHLWAQDKHVRLIRSQTINSAVKTKLARIVIDLNDQMNMLALTYDRWRANEIVAQCERAGVTCIPIQQNARGLSSACYELERRLKSGSLIIRPNPCLAWQASNVELLVDKYGNARPVKPNARGNYAGTRALKIDGIVAVVSAIAEHLRRQLSEPAPEEAAKDWDGNLVFL